MRSPKGFWLATAAITCIIVGMFLASGAIVALSLPIVVYIGIMAMLLDSSEAKLKIERRISDIRIMAGDVVQIEILVRNKGPRLELVEINDILPDYLCVKEGNNCALMSLDKDEVQSFTYTLDCPLRGRYLLENLKITVMDSGRLHSTEILFKEITEFSVVARVEPTRGINIAPKKTRNWVGMIKARRVGIGTEFYGLRNYVSGDEFRKINWKASARSDTLLTNEFEAECSGDATLILDARLEANVGHIEDCAVEHGVRAASTIASQILKDKNRVGLIVLRDIIDEVYPAFGKRQFYKLSEHLLDVKPLGLLPFENVGWMVTSYFPLESQIIVISTLTDRDIISTIGDLCARGYDVVVISPSPIRLESSLVDDSPEKVMASRIMTQERDNLISELGRYARIVDWDTDDALAKALRGVDASRSRR
ncbi:MAG: DUF58 domain-containing protein [Thermoplasmata archaeon]|nr:DUF58 domain-containing protein [Thermoplasmata archaeon]